MVILPTGHVTAGGLLVVLIFDSNKYSTDYSTVLKQEQYQ